MAQAPAGGKASSYKASARVGGKPDLSGVWSVMNTANWDIEPHAARSALMTRLVEADERPLHFLAANEQ